jgi:ornithine cyclodeaminase
MSEDDGDPAGTQSVTGENGVVVLTSADVRRYLPMHDCVDAMAGVFRDLGAGRVVQPVRQVIRMPGGAGALYVMPGFVGDAGGGALAVKLVSLFPGNAARGLESHQGAVVLFDATNGSVQAVIEAASLTAIRTAAVSALATRLLALPDASDLALLGSGVQAWSHLEAMLAVRPVRRVRVWSRTAAHAASFAGRATERFGVPVEASGSAVEALHEATLICTVTGAREPITRSEWIADGAHINAVGASTPATREIDSATVARARLVVDSVESAMAEAGDILIPMDEGLVTESSLTPLADIVAGTATPRRSASDVTLFESLGLAVEDVAAARLAYERAARAWRVPFR